jgi:glycerol kinase
MKYILALDQGTTSSRSVLFDSNGSIAGIQQLPFQQIYPKPAWVEHDPEEIWNTQMQSMIGLLKDRNVGIEDIIAIGITNQRETTIVWDRKTGKAIYNAIVWQDRRTAPICEQLKKSGLEEYIRNTTGLVVDAYFSGTKIKWILDHVEGARKKAEEGDLLFGTVDSWLLYRLTGGRVHATDYSNASRTLLYDIHNLKWDPKILSALDIPEAMLPEVKPSMSTFGVCDPEIAGAEVPICGVAGDQQSALFGQLCWKEGMAKNTYGTGCFMLMNTSDKAVLSKKGLLTTLAWGDEEGVQYALEGSVFIGGAVIQWLRDELGIIGDASETEQLALSIPDNGGVYFVPAFTGLGTPHWDMYARGSLLGLTRGCGRAHIARAALEAIVYQSCDVLNAMKEESGIELKSLRVDGGATANQFLMQYQADMLGVPVIRPANREATAQGAAYMAGLTAGLWTKEQLQSKWQAEETFSPDMDENSRKHHYSQWHKAVERAKGWEE